MNVTDYIIVGILIVSTIISIYRGFIREVVSLLVWGLAAWLSYSYNKELATAFTSVKNPLIRELISATLIFIAIIIIGGLLNMVLSKTVKYTGLGIVDRAIGIPFGIIRASFLICIPVMLLLSSNLKKETWWVESSLLPRFINMAEELKRIIPEELINKLTVLNEE